MSTNNSDLVGEIVLLCETPNGCTCGAPASTPRGMHHDDCGIRTPAMPSPGEDIG